MELRFHIIEAYYRKGQRYSMTMRDELIKQIQPCLALAMDDQCSENQDLFPYLLAQDQNYALEDGEENFPTEVFRSTATLVDLPSADKETLRFSRLDIETLLTKYYLGDKKYLFALIEKQKRYVYRCACQVFQQYKGHCLTPEDLFQEGIIAIIENAQRFRPGMNAYALNHRISRKMEQAIINTGSTIRVPMGTLTRQVNILSIALSNKNLSIEEICAMHNKKASASDYLTPSRLARDAVLLERCMLCASLDEPVIKGGEIELKDCIFDNKISIEETILQKEKIQKLNDYLNKLKPRQKAILEMIWGINGEPKMLVADISRLLKITRSRVSQIEIAARRKLKVYYRLESQKNNNV